MSNLPSVAGRMEMTHEHFQRACQVALGELQSNPNPDNSLVYLLCEAVRCSRECCTIAPWLFRINRWNIWSMEHKAFWAPNEHGYKTDWASAGHYSFADAFKIVNNANFRTGNKPNEAMIPFNEKHQL